jgi:hypothetical protein
MFWTPVPKATVHEHDEPVFAKDEIWSPDHSRVSPPTSDSVTPKETNQR